MELDDIFGYDKLVADGEGDVAERDELSSGQGLFGVYDVRMMSVSKGNMMTGMPTTHRSESIMDFRNEHAIETYRSLISIALAGLKTLMLINGGAVVALLAYLGQSPQGPSLAPRVLWSLGAFVAGVVFCVGAFFGSYQTQFALFNEAVSPATKSGLPHMTWRRITIAFVLLSCAAFAIGAFSSVWLLSHKA